MENKPIVLLTFESGRAEILCSRKLQLLKAYHKDTPEALLEILPDYKKEPEGYNCFGSYYVLEHAEINKGLILETSAGDYKWI